MPSIVGKYAAFLALACGLTGSLFAVGEKKMEIPGDYLVAPELDELLDPKVLSFYKQELARALWLVSQLPPEGTPPAFSAKALGNSRVAFYVTVTGDLWVPIFKIPADERTALVRMTSSTDSAPSLMQVYLLDRLYFNPDHSAKKGGFAELLAAAAYQNYGLMPYFFERDIVPTYPRRGEDAQLTEAQRSIHNYSLLAEIVFLQRFIRSKWIATLDPDSVVRLGEILERERVELLMLQCHH